MEHVKTICLVARNNKKSFICRKSGFLMVHIIRPLSLFYKISSHKLGGKNRDAVFSSVCMDKSNARLALSEKDQSLRSVRPKECKFAPSLEKLTGFPVQQSPARPWKRDSKRWNQRMHQGKMPFGFRPRCDFHRAMDSDDGLMDWILSPTQARDIARNVDEQEGRRRRGRIGQNLSGGEMSTSSSYMEQTTEDETDAMELSTSETEGFLDRRKRKRRRSITVFPTIGIPGDGKGCRVMYRPKDWNEVGVTAFLSHNEEDV